MAGEATFRELHYHRPSYYLSRRIGLRASAQWVPRRQPCPAHVPIPASARLREHH